MPMKKLVAILCFTLPVLFCSCKQDDETLSQQQQKIVSYLTSTHVPKLVAVDELEEGSQLPYYTVTGNGSYRYIDGVYNPDRDNWTEVTAASTVTVTFRAYIFTFANIVTSGKEITMPYYSNDPALEAAYEQAGLTLGKWDFKPYMIDMRSPNILKGLYLSLTGCREGDVVEVYMSYNMAYGETNQSIIPINSPIAYFFTVDKVE